MTRHRRTQSWHRLATRGAWPRALAVAGSLVAAGCLVVDFDPDADAVFTCELDGDCGSAQTCELGVCRSDDGPKLRVAGPPDLSVVPSDASAPLELVVQGEALTLAPPGAAAEGSGYLEVTLDGAPLPKPVEAGALESGVPVPLPVEGLPGGLHRVRVRAVGLDGTPYSNPSATADVTFWIDDGETHVGIRRPWPGDPQLVDRPLEVEIAALRFVFADPNRPDLQSTTEPTRGHTHVYVGKEYPSCLPDCNGGYAPDGMIAPTGAEELTLLRATIGGAPTEPQTLSLTASLNYSNHAPVGSPVLSEVEEAIASGALIYDAINVKFVE